MKLATLLLFACVTFGADASKLDAKAAFARLKSLVGEWQADTSMGKVNLSYEVVAGGTALVEKETFERMDPMLTVFHLDNGQLMLTHYCHAGNQPRMRASAFNPETGEIQFDFLDITNAADKNVGHMHSAKVKVESGSVYLANWEFWEGGKKKSTETFRYIRVR